MSQLKRVVHALEKNPIKVDDIFRAMQNSINNYKTKKHIKTEKDKYTRLALFYDGYSIYEISEVTGIQPGWICQTLLSTHENVINFLKWEKENV